jgi:hypothetical protein
MPRNVAHQRFTVRVHGYKEFARSVRAADRATQRIVRDELMDAADIVRDDAQRMFKRYSVKTASGFKVSAPRVGGVFVEQRLRKVTGKRRDWGRIQKEKALNPALERNANTVEHNVKQAVQRIERMIKT